MPAYAVDAAAPVSSTKWPNYWEGDFVIRNFAFRSGETLPELNLHYRTLGTPKRNPAGKIVNGVLLLQGNTGTGANWLRPSLADELFAPGQPLDATEYFMIMPDAIGRGGSSKPSDGLRGNFPRYRYHDMVESGMIMKYSVASSGWPGANSSSARLGRNQLAPVPVLPCNSSTPLTILPAALHLAVPRVR